METIAIVVSVAVSSALYGLLKAVKYLYKNSNINCKSSCHLEHEQTESGGNAVESSSS